MKRTTIVASLMLTSLLFTFNACKKDAAPVAPPAPENKEAVSVENGRLVFKTTKDFYQYIDEAKPETSSRPGFRSLYTALREGHKKSDKDPALSATLADLEKFNFPSGFLATLNEKGEVKVGDEIIWYNKGTKYFIPAGDDAKLEAIKQKPAMIKRSIRTHVPDLNTRTYLYVRGLDARHQWEPDASPFDRRKYVDEIYGFFDGYYDAAPGIKGYKAYLILRVKLEWRGCCDWNPAGEERSITVNVSGFGNLLGTNPNPFFTRYLLGPNFTVNESRVTRENYDITLVSVDGLGTLTDERWDLEISGAIRHKITLAPNSEWNNVATPLW